MQLLLNAFAVFYTSDEMSLLILKQSKISYQLNKIAVIQQRHKFHFLKNNVNYCQMMLLVSQEI